MGGPYTLLLYCLNAIIIPCDKLVVVWIDKLFIQLPCRHSDYSVRPMFSAIFNMLSHSPSHLLSWAERDLSIHPQVACLGAPLEVTEELFTELQDYYMISDIQSKRRHKKGSKTADW